MRSLAIILLITSFLMAGAVAKSQLQADESLVLYLSFDEGKGEIAKDLSQYGNDGTIKGGIEWVSGKFSKSLRYDGATGYIEVPHSDSLNVEASFTVENWAYPEDILREQNVAEKGLLFALCSSMLSLMEAVMNPTQTNWKRSWLDHIKTVRGYVFAIAASGWNPIWLATSAKNALEAQKWYHLAMTWDGTTRTLYVNGEEDGSDKPTGSLVPNKDPVYIAGGRNPYYYKGIYDEIRIWNRALSQKEIKESMEMGRDQLFPVNPLNKLTTTWASIKKQ